jgi:hypothetical protein
VKLRTVVILARIATINTSGTHLATLFAQELIDDHLQIDGPAQAYWLGTLLLIDDLVYQGCGLLSDE